MRKHLFALLLLAALLAPIAAPMPAPAQDSGVSKVYLPSVRGSGNGPVFGIEMARLSAERGIDLVTTSGSRWVRRNALPWKLIEPAPGGGYSWDHPLVQQLEQDMIRASQLGINLVLVVNGSPAWAVIPHKADCAPINAQFYGDYARFLAAATARYSQPPYNVKYWELTNEPDAPLSPTDNVFGCWGIAGDPYFGGQAFGEMLKVAVPAMKAVNPTIQVLNGGLMLDQPYVEGVSPNTMGRFFEGVLLAGAGPLIDIVSFHTYVFFRTPGQPALGPREDWRVGYLRELMRRYKVPERPLMRTETALLCVVVTPECRWAQADLVGRSYARTLRDGVMATIWYIYDQDGFHNTALIEPSDVWVPRPAYFAFRHAARMLNGASYIGPIPGLPAAAEGYMFSKGGKVIYVYWTDEPAGVSFALPITASGPVVCTDRDGGPVTCAVAGGVLPLTAQVSPAFVSVGQ
jgi:hypothetical protein